MRRRIGAGFAAMALAATLAAAVPLVAPPPARAQAAGPGLTSAPYDLSLFRDGETRRMRARYGGWTAVCDEIIRLHSRYCSLSAAVSDAAGGVVARLDVSTDDAGRPAALLHLPLGTLFDRPVTLGPGGPHRADPGRRPAPRALRATRCDAAGCAAVWELDASDFDALKRGGFALTYRRTSRLDVPGAWLKASDVETVTGSVPADGFGDAVAASLRAGPLAEAAEGDGLGLRR